MKKSDEELQKMNDKQLYYHFRETRAKVSYIFNYYGRRCCELCHEYIGDDWENDVAQYLRPADEYFKKVKSIMSAREYDASKDKPTKKKRRAMALQHRGQNKSKNR